MMGKMLLTDFAISNGQVRNNNDTFCKISRSLRRSDVVVSALDFPSDIGRLDGLLVSSLLCCFLTQETLLHIVSLHSGVQMGTDDILLRGGGGGEGGVNPTMG